MNKRISSPDCRDGKHSVCVGAGWDIDADTAVRCPCTCHKDLTVYKIAYACCTKDKPCEVHRTPPIQHNLLADRLGIQE